MMIVRYIFPLFFFLSEVKKIPSTTGTTCSAKEPAGHQTKQMDNIIMLNKYVNKQIKAQWKPCGNLSTK